MEIQIEAIYRKRTEGEFGESCIVYARIKRVATFGNMNGRCPCNVIFQEFTNFNLVVYIFWSFCFFSTFLLKETTIVGNLKKKRAIKCPL